MHEAQGEAIRDCAINAAVVRVEHFEMGTYRGMVTGAQQMGQDQIVNLLSENLQQAEQTQRRKPSREAPSCSRRPCRTDSLYKWTHSHPLEACLCLPVPQQGAERQFKRLCILSPRRACRRLSTDGSLHLVAPYAKTYIGPDL